MSTYYFQDLQAIKDDIASCKNSVSNLSLCLTKLSNIEDKLNDLIDLVTMIVYPP